MTEPIAAGLSHREALRQVSGRFGAANLPPSDARFLVLGVLDLNAVDLALHGDRIIGLPGAARLEDAVRRRLSGEPVARILGAWEFWGLPFRLSPETLVPRPDTETVVEAALRRVRDRAAPLRILDLGTGSGCILVALLSELPKARGIGLDRSHCALRTARANAGSNGVGDRAAFVTADWCGPLAGRFDLVVSNPPYIAEAVIAALDPEVRSYDPRLALDGGRDGLDAYRRILGDLAGSRLAEGGIIVLETGYDQAEKVMGLGTAVGFVPCGIDRDLAGQARVVSFGTVSTT